VRGEGSGETPRRRVTVALPQEVKEPWNPLQAWCHGSVVEGAAVRGASDQWTA